MKDLLRSIPKVSELLDKYKGKAPQVYVKKAVRKVLEKVREEIISGKRNSLEDLERLLEYAVEKESQTKLKRVINATGIVINTNLGRSPVSEEVIDFIRYISTGYSNLEYDLEKGKRGSRQSLIEDYLVDLTGAESALVVNNNAGAVFLVLNTLALGKDVLISRGELVEIGGSFRIPDIMKMSGANLVEVGTTNRTRLEDYKASITEKTALIMKVHRSNFYMEGFVQDTSLEELLSLGLPVYYDAGSGLLVNLKSIGLNVEEPSFKEALSLGVHIVSGSGDKLLGGPQAGIILGKREFIDKMKKNPMSRALRIDKLTLAGLEMTLRLYMEGRIDRIPTLRMLGMKEQELKRRANRLARILKGCEDVQVRVVKDVSQCGGGALPSLYLPTYCVAIRHKSLKAHELERFFRNWKIPIVGRIKDDTFLLDVRTLLDGDFTHIGEAVKSIQLV